MMRHVTPFEAVLASFRTLGNEQGLLIVNALSQGPARVDQLVQAIGLPAKAVDHYISELSALELVLPQPGPGGYVYTLQKDRLHALPHTLLHMTLPSASPPAPPPTDFDEKVLRDYLVNGRLTQIPSQEKKRQVILRYLVTLFEPNRRYSEREVNAIIQDVHPDSASLRRYLVDTHLMARDHGVYWRLKTKD
jgi:hypothetical protein